jgi:GNAT superfamily N-acetyltransferase
MAPTIITRRATTADVEAILAIVKTGFDSYTTFAAPGWAPPDIADDRERTVALLSEPTTWGLLALDDGRPVGHFAFTPARRRTADEVPGDWREREPIPGLAHLWQLFVLPEWWGSGVAARLRLFTPSGQARARRFYERRGWTPVVEQFNPELGLDLVEYRLELRSAG